MQRFVERVVAHVRVEAQPARDGTRACDDASTVAQGEIVPIFLLQHPVAIDVRGVVVRADRQAVRDGDGGMQAVEVLGGGPVRLSSEVYHGHGVVRELRDNVIVEEWLLRRCQRRVHVVRENLEEGLGPLAGALEDDIAAHVALRCADKGCGSGRRRPYAELLEAVESDAYAHGGRVTASPQHAL